MLTFDLLQVGKPKQVPNDDRFGLHKTKNRTQINTLEI